MKTVYAPLLPVFLLMLVLSSCNNSDLPVTLKPAEYGAISGKVHPRTEITDVTSDDTVDYAGVVITVSGTTHTFTTDTSGNWFFSGLTEGEYLLSFSKPGYSEFKLAYARVVKNDTSDYPIYLYKLTSARMTELSYSVSASQITLNYKLNVNKLRQYYVRFFFSLDSNIGNPLSNYAYTEAELLLNVTDTVSYRNYVLEIINLYSNGLTSGKRIYLYGNVGFKNQYYTDPFSGKKIYNSLSAYPASRLSLFLP
jgi:hypothetical protein